MRETDELGRSSEGERGRAGERMKMETPREVLAEPVLAVSLVDEKDLDGIVERAMREQRIGVSSAADSRRRDGGVETSVKSVDDAFGRGLRGTGMVAMSGELGMGRGVSDVSALSPSFELSISPKDAFYTTRSNIYGFRERIR